jgi:hypothetical protein
MIKVPRLVIVVGLGAGLFFGVTMPALSQGTLPATPEAAPATGAAEGDKAAKQGDREDQSTSGTESNGDTPKSGPGGCPYIKRKLDLIV